VEVEGSIPFARSSHHGRHRENQVPPTGRRASIAPRFQKECRLSTHCGHLTARHLTSIVGTEETKWMSKSLSLGDAIIATAEHKHEAATARSSPVAGERPRDVILRSCEAIADKLKEDGFSFVKSGPKLKRVQADRVFTIWFQSDRNNIAGRRAAVWIHAGIQEARSGTRIAGGQIGNLVAEPTWMEWDFADEVSRQNEISDAVAAIRRIILPFFATFENQAA
jgi:hypothetical protein